MTDTLKIILTAAATGASVMLLDIIKNTYRSKGQKVVVADGNGNGSGNAGTKKITDAYERRSECIVHQTQIASFEKALVSVTTEIKSSIAGLDTDIKSMKDVTLLAIIKTQTRNETNIKANYTQLKGILRKLNMAYPTNGD